MLQDNQFLVCGSAAGEGIPSPFCKCRICEYARQHGGKDIRTRAGYQLGETIRFDWGPEALVQGNRFHLDYSKLQHLFITHSHSDHFYPLDFWTRHPDVSVVTDDLHVYGNEAVCKAMNDELKEPEAYHVQIHMLKPFEPVQANFATVTPLLADHISSEQCFLYLVEAHGKRLLIGHDSQNYPEETMEFMKGKRCDYFLPDSTWAIKQGQMGHMGIPDGMALYKRFVATGAADEHTQVIPTHISPNHGSLHAEIEEFLKPYPNFTPAYDGMILEM